MYYCKIQKHPIQETVEDWAVGLEFSNKAIHQFYLLAPTKESFDEYYHYFTKELGSIPARELRLATKSWNLEVPLLESVEHLRQLGGDCAIAVTNFNEAYESAFADITEESNFSSYSRNRFGHDYTQQLVEGKTIRGAFTTFPHKIVIFTWVNSNNKRVIQTACVSQFRDGMAEPVENIGNYLS